MTRIHRTERMRSELYQCVIVVVERRAGQLLDTSGRSFPAAAFVPFP